MVQAVIFLFVIVDTTRRAAKDNVGIVAVFIGKRQGRAKLGQFGFKLFAS
jgi:hypothetical protein